MTIPRYLMVFMIVSALALPVPARSATEAAAGLGMGVAGEGGAAAGGPSAGGRGEGYEPEAEATKGEEIPATFGPIITDTAIPVEKGKFVIQPTFGYSVANSVFNESWRRTGAGGNFQSFAMDWRLTYGLIDDMEVFVVIPYVHNAVRNLNEAGPKGETSGSSGGLADINLTLKYRLVEETATLPTVTALFATDFPTGKFKNLNPSAMNTDVLGGGAYVFTAGFNVSKYLDPFIVYGNLWYSTQTAYADDGGNQYPGDFVTVNVAAEYPITKKWVALLELTSAWGGGRLFGPRTNLPRESVVSIAPGIEYIATDKISVALGLNIGLVGKHTDAAITPLLSMAYAF